MSEYFWQGGKKIPISPSANQITIQADSEDAVSDLASDAGVSLQNVEKVAEVGTLKSWRIVCKARPNPSPALNGALAAKRIRTRRRTVS